MVVHNPNNWHWVDKNCIDWSRDYFNKKLVGISASTDSGQEASVTSVSSVEGDVEVCQRKGKVISLFDLKLVLNFKGKGNSTSDEFNGSITVPELAYDSTEDDIQFDVSIYNENADSEKSRPFIKSKLLPQIRSVLAGFGSDLIETHSSDIQLSSDKVKSSFTKANQETSAAGKTTQRDDKSTKQAAAASRPAASASSAAKKSEASATGVPRYNTSTLHLEPTFNTTAEQLYITLLDQARIAAWTRSPPTLDAFPPKEGSAFKLFGGSITGKFVTLVPNERVIQLWRLEDWKDGHYAQLDIQLIQGSSDTKMIVKWSGIPIGEEDRVRGNFEDYYVRSIKLTFGFGAVL